MSKTPSRIYTVTRAADDTIRLVRATSQAQALRHVALDEYTVEVASQTVLVDTLANGVQVEIATTADA